MAKFDVAKVKKGDRLRLELEATDVWHDDAGKVEKITVAIAGQRVTIAPHFYHLIVENLGS